MSSSYPIDIFHGQLSAHSAQVYARVAGLPGGHGWTITGRVRGPECRHAKSLAANHPLVDLGAGETLLARSTLPDPCFWSPDLPALYRVTVELRHRGDLVQAEERELGLRFLGVRRNSFFLEGKRWVLRGMHYDCVEPAPLAAWREAGAAMLVDDPEDELCREATREGVFLMARVTGDDSAVLRRLSQSACVAVVVLPGSSGLWSEMPRQFPNMLLGQDGAAYQCDQLPESCSVVLFDSRKLNSQDFHLATVSVPTIAVRKLSRVQLLGDARAECDCLQRDLASIGDFAGYFIDREAS